MVSRTTALAEELALARPSPADLEELCGQMLSMVVIRNVLRIIDAVAFYLVGAFLIWRSDKKQRFGDSVAKTIVVKA